MINPKERKAVNNWSNSLLRPFVPVNLLENSKIKATTDDGAKLVYVKFFYGVKTGKLTFLPFDGTIDNVVKNLDDESLWVYSMKDETIPMGFVEKNYKPSIITTGKVRKCDRCRGQGLVQCSTCKGKVRWHEKNIRGEVVEVICSCGNGKQNCGKCKGFCDLEDVIQVDTKFKLHQSKNSQYLGQVPEIQIKKVTGNLVYENQFDYPIETMKDLLIGGLNQAEINRLNDNVLRDLKTNLELKLANSDIDTAKVYAQLLQLFLSITQLMDNNKVFEKEFMPIRVLVRVENAPVKQIDYTYKNKDYSIWVYGNQNAVWRKQTPMSFNIKVIAILIVILGIAGLMIWNSIQQTI